MSKIPDSFRPYKQFINWKLVDKGDGKKLAKVPYNALHNVSIDPMIPGNWLTADEALLYSQYGWGIAFIFTKDDPFFFLDIDNCLVDGQWSQMAQGLCRMFAGCYIEVSHSGKGLHIFGSGVYPEHSCRNEQYGLEFYSEKHSAALTGEGAIGDANFNAQPAIDWLITNYFPPATLQGAPLPEWTDGPCPEWHGIEDDHKLIEKALASKRSTAAAFGVSASFADLWAGDISFHGDDHSFADAALCQRLAFWTGKDCARIDRLFRLSGLMRPKWDDSRGQSTYGAITILQAVSKCDKVYGECPPRLVGALREGLQFLSVDQQIEYFAGCTYVTDRHRIVTPKGQFLNPDQFKAVYSGWVFALDNINGSSTPDPYKAFTQSQGYDFPKVDTTCFRPELPEMSPVEEQGGLTMLNTWLKLDIKHHPGDASPFLNHLAAILPVETDREILLSFFAAAIQNPGKKIPWMPIIQGVQGNGKSMLIRIMEYAVGHRYAHRLNAADLAKNALVFNGWLRGKLFVGIEEIYVPKRREVLEALKTYITEDRIEIQNKGVDQISGDNRANFAACTNYKDGVPKYRGDRRNCILFTAQQSEDDMVRMGWKYKNGNSTQYFAKLYKWLYADGFAIVTHMLKTYQIKDQFNPFVEAVTAPITSSTLEAIACSQGNLEQDVMEAIDEGRSGFISPWISSFAYNRLIDERRQKISQNRRRQILVDMGYVPHPALRDGRLTILIPSEGGKPRIYVKANHPAAQIGSAALVAQEYLRCQSGDMVAVKFNQGSV